MGASARRLAAEEVKVVADLPPRMNATELAVYLGVSVSFIRYRVQQGKLPEPDAQGMFDRKVAEKAYRRCPKMNKGPRVRKGREGAFLSAARMRETPLPEGNEEEKSRKPTASSPIEESYDPDTRFRLAKARIAEINLGRLREDTIDVKLVQRRAFHFVRLIRDRLDAKVPRSSPVIAAELGADEGLTFRLLRKMMRELETEIAEMDFDAVLKGGIPEEREEEAEGDAEEGEDDPLPKLKPKLPRRRKKQSIKTKPKSKGGR